MTPLKPPPGFIIREGKDTLEQVNALGRRLRGRPQRFANKKKKKTPKKPKPAFYSVFERLAVQFRTINIHETDFARLGEMTRFYGFASKPRTLTWIIRAAFEKAYEESLLLQKIHERKNGEIDGFENDNAVRAIRRGDLQKPPTD